MPPQQPSASPSPSLTTSTPTSTSSPSLSASAPTSAPTPSTTPNPNPSSDPGTKIILIPPSIHWASWTSAQRSGVIGACTIAAYVMSFLSGFMLLVLISHIRLRLPPFLSSLIVRLPSHSHHLYYSFIFSLSSRTYPSPCPFFPLLYHTTPSPPIIPHYTTLHYTAPSPSSPFISHHTTPSPLPPLYHTPPPPLFSPIPPPAPSPLLHYSPPLFSPPLLLFPQPPSLNPLNPPKIHIQNQF